MRWYAANTPVMPEPMMHISASEVREPLLPAFASEFASEESQKNRVGLWMGSRVGLRSWAPGIGVDCSGSACVGVTPFEAEEDIWCVRTTDAQAEGECRCGRGDISCRASQEGTSLYGSMTYCEGEERPELQAVLYFEGLC